MIFRQTDEEFLATKPSTIGASEVGVILGVSNYTTRYELYISKKSKTLKDMNKVMEAGKMLENPVLDKYFYKARGEKFEYSDTVIAVSHPQYDYILVHPDDLFMNRYLIEVKTTQKYLNQATVRDHVESNYFPQWNFTLGVILENDPNFSLDGFVIVFSRGFDYFEVPLEFNKELYDKSLQAVIEFKENLDSNNAPELEGSDYDLVYVLSNGEDLESDSEMNKRFKDLVKIRETLKENESKELELVTFFKSKLKEKERLVNSNNGRTMLTWRTSKKGRIFRVYN